MLKHRVTSIDFSPTLRVPRRVGRVGEVATEIFSRGDLRAMLSRKGNSYRTNGR